MSRCYPFPPRGYVRNETLDESLVESIKGTKDEVKRGRKHKKDKKRKERDNEADHRSKKHRHHKRRRKDKVDDGRGLIANNELECLEKSCLTVELEHQTSSQNSCDSRPNHIQSPLLLDGRQYGSETSIRILLHGKEHEHQDAELMITNKGQNEATLDPSRVCQEKRRREFTAKLSKEKKTVPLESERQIRTPLGKEKPSSSHQETVGASKLCSKGPSSTAVRFLNLIENWAPDLMEGKLNDSEDHELVAIRQLPMEVVRWCGQLFGFFQKPNYTHCHSLSRSDFLKALVQRVVDMTNKLFSYMYFLELEIYV